MNFEDDKYVRAKNRLKEWKKKDKKEKLKKKEDWNNELNLK